MTIITPSQWLAGLVKQSYLREYPVNVKYNTVDTRIFKPTPGSFRKQYKLEDKKIVLGVASAWDERKGLQDFFRLAGMLDDSYVVVLVGLDKKQRKKAAGMVECARIPKQELGRNIRDKRIQTDLGVAVYADVRELYAVITGQEYGNVQQTRHAALLCLPGTNSASELAKIYTAADFFINPTYEDNYPTVNLEAIACGTYVITYLTGGSPETLSQAAHE